VVEPVRIRGLEPLCSCAFLHVADIDFAGLRTNLNESASGVGHPGQHKLQRDEKLLMWVMRLIFPRRC
jgi:hypothetical protein